MKKRGISAVRCGGALLTILALLILVPGELIHGEETEEENLPPAMEIINRSIEATGGEAAMRKHTSYELTGEFKMAAAGLAGPLTVYAKAPNLSLLQLEIPGLGTVREGFDGSVGWSIDPTQGPSLKEGKQLDQAKFGADFYAALNVEDRYTSMETVEKTEFNGASCYKLHLVRNTGDEVIQYYDSESHLLIGIDSTVETPMGPIASTMRMEKYEEFDGVRLPTHMVQTMGPGMEQVLSFSDVKINSVDAKVFDLPEEIQTLLKEPAVEK